MKSKTIKKSNKKIKKKSIDAPKQQKTKIKVQVQEIKSSKIKKIKQPKKEVTLPQEHVSKKEKKKLYVDKKEMIDELRHFKNTGVITEKLGQMFIDIATHLSSKGCFFNYSYKKDMIRDAVARMVMQIDRFNPDHPMANPFWYFSTVATRQFLTYIKSEKRYANTKEIVSDRYMDDLISQTGMVDPRSKTEDEGFESEIVIKTEIVSYYTDDPGTSFYVNNDVVDVPADEEEQPQQEDDEDQEELEDDEN